MKASKIISTLIGLMMLGAAWAFAFLPERRKPVSEPLPILIPDRKSLVKVADVSMEAASKEIRFSGITRASRRAVLSFSVPARMTKRPVEVGDRVRRGQIIAGLDTREFNNAVDSAEAAEAELKARLDQARRDRKRLELLMKDGAAAVKDFEQAAASVDALTASLQAARVRLKEARRVRSETDLKAPFSGTITAVRLEPGEWAEPGKPVAELFGDKRFELEVDVPETVIGRLKEGDPVDVILPFFKGKRLEGRVDALARAALSSGRLFPLVVALDPAPGLTAGLTAELILTLRTEPMTFVPIGAIVNPGTSRPMLFIVKDDRVRKVPVSLGSFYGNRVVVSGDLSQGDQVVVSGNTTLSDGKRVEVKP